MLDALREFIRTLAGEASGEARRFDADDARLALAALLVHAMAIDGAVTAAERVTLKDLLARNFGLAGADLDTLVDEAIAADNDAVDLYRFTSVLKRQMDEAQRAKVIENLWEIAFADGSATEFEENLVWRVAELLGVERRARIASRKSVEETIPAKSSEPG